MTESDWPACRNPRLVLASLLGVASTRKLRCFAFACGRRYCVIWEEAAATDDHYRRVKPAVDGLCGRIIDAVERLDDGQGTAETVESLRRQLWERSAAPIGLNWDITATIKGDADHWVRRYEDDCLTASEQASRPATRLWRDHNERLFQADLLRDIFGHLAFRTPRFDPRWGTPTVLSLAQAAYEERVAPDPSRPAWLVLDPARLLVLADALEEAGADAEVVIHLRGEAPHVRGCFVVDAILGR